MQWKCTKKTISKVRPITKYNMWNKWTYLDIN